VSETHIDVVDIEGVEVTVTSDVLPAYVALYTSIVVKLPSYTFVARVDSQF